MTRALSYSLLAWATLVSPAAAQSDVDVARSLFEDGVAAYERASFAEALRLFTESYEVRESQIVLFNLAVTEQQLGRDEDALRHLEVWLSRDDGNEPDRRQAVEAAVAQLAPRLARVRVSLTPSQAVVTVDGAAAQTTGDGLVVLRPGVYRIGGELEGYEDATEEVTLEAGSERSLSLTLTELPEDADPEPAPVVTLAPAAPSPVPWVVLGLGTAALIAGAITGIVTLSKHADLAERCPTNPCIEDVEDDKSTGEALALVTDILLFGGAAIAATGVVLFFVLDGDDSESPAPTAACGPTGCVGGVRGTF